VYHYIQSYLTMPDFVVDISAFMDKKMQAIRAFTSQFHDPENTAPETYISRPGFLRMIESRAAEFGYGIGVDYGEGFTQRRYPGVNSLFDLL
jgi:LmbE family N-acetylglucosaminyl deacetylase